MESAILQNETSVSDSENLQPVPAREFENVKDESVGVSPGIEINEVPQDITWMLSENIPGKGDKPEWLIDSKYKTVAEQAKGYNELRKSYSELESKSSGFADAPEQYEVNLSEELKEVELNLEDPFFNKIAESARESNISQVAFDKLVNTWVDFAAQEEASFSTTQQTEFEALGASGLERLERIQTWSTNNFNEDVQGKLRDYVQTADDVEFFENIINLSQGTALPTSVNQTPSHSRDDLKAMMADKRYANDQSFTKKVDELYKDAAQRGILDRN